MPVDPARAKSLFLAASDLADPAERAAYLDRACGDDAELRERVEALLRADASAGDATSAHEPGAPVQTEDYVAAQPEPGVVIAGRYTLVEKIGEGGMGEVWVAKQTEPVKRRVALKLIKAGMDSKAVLQRFEQERQALALMDHPNIARVLDGGLTQDRRPFFVMELVNGLSLTKFCDDAKLSPRDRLELFVPICQAVQHAHQKGIVHRDLKPSNILVTLYDGKPVPKVIDFGVAKATGGKLTDESLSTQFGAVVGTLEYMSPEQAGFSAIDIDTRADIYSLGVILYELLTGLKPHDSQRLRQAALTEMIRIIQEEEPSKPSTRLSTDDALPSLAAVRQTEPKKLMAMLRGELDWVVMKCLEKQRDRRYESANGLARDIRRFLADEPVEARPPSAGYRLKKFLRRHKGPVIAGILLLLAVLGGVVGTSIGMVEAQKARSEEALREAADRERLIRNGDAIESLLGQCEEALRADDAEKAGLALDQAERRAGEGGADRLTDRLTWLRAELQILRDLDRSNDLAWSVGDGYFQRDAAAEERTRAFARYGIVPGATPPSQAAERVSRSLVRERLLIALHQWLAEARSPELLGILRAADREEFRSSLREAFFAGDDNRVRELASSPAALAQPAWVAVVLADRQSIPLDRRHQLLRNAVYHRPAEFSLLLNLAFLSKSPADLEWHRAAVAVRPRSPIAWGSLGDALRDKGDVEGAITAYKEAIRLDPDYTAVHTRLGNTLLRKGDYDGAIAAHRQALKGYRHYYHKINLCIALGHKGLRDGIAGWPEPKTPQEACEFAALCSGAQKFVLAVRVCDRVFTADPRAADELAPGWRIYAANCAALSAAGKDAESGVIGPDERAYFTGRAYSWLRAELTGLAAEGPRRWPSMLTKLLRASNKMT
jgi:serine/threonine protein kinase